MTSARHCPGEFFTHRNIECACCSCYSCWDTWRKCRRWAFRRPVVERTIGLATCRIHSDAGSKDNPWGVFVSLMVTGGARFPQRPSWRKMLGARFCCVSSEGARTQIFVESTSVCASLRIFLSLPAPLSLSFFVWVSV